MINAQSIFFFFATVLFSSGLMANDWGKTGHRVVGEIAQQHLTPKASKKINQLLGGKSLAYVSIYADEIRSDGRYDHLAPWHYVNFKGNEKYQESEKNPDGDKNPVTCPAPLP